VQVNVCDHVLGWGLGSLLHPGSSSGMIWPGTARASVLHLLSCLRASPGYLPGTVSAWALSIMG
jgi:hypothetical protein